MPVLSFDDADQARAVRAALQSGTARVLTVQRARLQENAPPPFTTATLLQEMTALGWTTERTLTIAQGLFEQGWITYPRTDSTFVTIGARLAARQVAAQRFGAANLLPEQAAPAPDPGAHEAIRPTDPTRLPDTLPDDEQRLLYTRVWLRLLAAQLQPAQVEQVTLEVEVAA